MFRSFVLFDELKSSVVLIHLILTSRYENVWVVLPILLSKEESQVILHLFDLNTSNDHLYIQQYQRKLLRPSKFLSTYIRIGHQDEGWYIGCLWVRNKCLLNVFIQVSSWLGLSKVWSFIRLQVVILLFVWITPCVYVILHHFLVNLTYTVSSS